MVIILACFVSQGHLSSHRGRWSQSHSLCCYTCIPPHKCNKPCNLALMWSLCIASLCAPLKSHYLAISNSDIKELHQREELEINLLVSHKDFQRWSAQREVCLINLNHDFRSSMQYRSHCLYPLDAVSKYFLYTYIYINIYVLNIFFLSAR